jgi:hypothetical protein
MVRYAMKTDTVIALSMQPNRQNIIGPCILTATTPTTNVMARNIHPPAVRLKRLNEDGRRFFIGITAC